MENFRCWHPCGNFWHAGAGCLQRVMMINSHLGICFLIWSFLSYCPPLSELLSTRQSPLLQMLQAGLTPGYVFQLAIISIGASFQYVNQKNLFDIFIFLCHSVYPYRLFLHLGFFSSSTSQRPSCNITVAKEEEMCSETYSTQKQLYLLSLEETLVLDLCVQGAAQKCSPKFRVWPKLLLLVSA